MTREMDIVERLRNPDGHGSKTECEAATEIERLRALVARYIELDLFDCDAPVGKSDDLEDLENQARRELKHKP